MNFEDRRAAGRILAQAVHAQMDLREAVVYGLARGGVPVAFEVALACKCPLDVFVARKLGVPGQRELAMGAIASDGTVVLNQEIVEDLRIREEVVQAVTERERTRAEQQENQYRAGRAPFALEGRTVILVDDGLATGATMRAALRSMRHHAQQIVVAIPVGAIGACHDLAREADRILCISTPIPFGAVGQFYQNFEPTSDDEVMRLLRDAHARNLSRT